MTRLILTTDQSAAGGLKAAGLADVAITLARRVVWGPLPSEAQLEAFFAAHTTQEQGLHWQDYTPSWRLEKYGAKDLGCIEFCATCESVELWIDPEPNAQLTLIWLLDYLRPHEKIVSKLTLVQADFVIGSLEPKDLAKKRPPAVKVVKDHLEAASMAWQAYRQPTPQDWFNLLGMDLSVLPQLRQTVLELLEELPMRVTGLGATEMRMLELVSAGKARPFDVFPGDRKRNQRRVFSYWEVGALLDALVRCPVPAVSGLEERPFTLAMVESRRRRKRYEQSRLSLTPLGKAVLAQSDDFSRHNPVDRWWGGTKLTNGRLRRWDPANQALVAP
jgi:hypothetical protein